TLTDGTRSERVLKMETRAWVTLLAVLARAPRGRGAGGGPIAVPPSPPAARGAAASDAAASPEMLYNSGVQASAKGDWKQAEAAYRRAIEARDQFPEAWNGLGHALKKQRRFGEAPEAHKKPLTRRPQCPQALEYLGETYVAMGKLGEARDTLAKRKPLDAGLATQLEGAINAPRASDGGW